MSELAVREPEVEPPLTPVRLLRGLKIRIVTSLVLVVGGFLFLVLYLAFWGTRFAWYENLAVVISTIVLVPVLMFAMWALWGIGIGQRLWRQNRRYQEL
ncbi:MAG: hypothetical protein L3K03_05165 [Thermoplasmata archaeon]|nr:hypothetical protein [Thermoplasmata archaeon]